MNNTVIKIIIVDDHTVVRRGIRMLLEDVDEFNVVDEATNGVEAIKKCKELSPDIIISDITMPDMTGLELTKTLQKECPKIKVLLLTMHQESEYVINAFKSGAFGYLHKGVQEDEIVTAIIQIMNGEKYYSSEVSEILMQNLINDKKEAEPLTKREQEVLKELIDGLSNKQIASKLFISIRTVDTHRSNIMNKLQVNNTAALVKYALQNNLID